MYNSHVLEKDSCYDPEIEEAVVILDALVSYHCLSKKKEKKKGGRMCFTAVFGWVGRGAGAVAKRYML